MSDELRPDEHDELARAVRRAFSAYRAPVRDVDTGRRRAPFARPMLGRPRLFALSAGAGLAVLLVAGALLGQSLVRPTSVFAGWTAVPASPDPTLALAADEDCRPLLRYPPLDSELAETLWDEEQRKRLAQLGDPSNLPLAAMDQRGEVALAFFSDGRSYAICVVGVPGGYTVAATGEIPDQRTGALRVLSGVSYDGEPPLHALIGDVANDVSTVTVLRDDGVSVTASVTNGYFLAWWPTANEVVSITASDAAGNVLDTLDGDLVD